MDKDILNNEIFLTGKIVGMMERNWRRYIATVPSVDMDAMERSTGRKVLVCPFDRRIPKIRVQEMLLSTARQDGISYLFPTFL